MKTFEPGKTYQTRSVCDHDCIILETIVSRTPKTVRTATGKTFRVKVWHDGSTEYFMPWGTYSMAPHMTAERKVAP